MPLAMSRTWLKSKAAVTDTDDWRTDDGRDPREGVGDNRRKRGELAYLPFEVSRFHIS